MSTVSTYIVFDGMVENPSVSAFQNVFGIENQLNIKKVMKVWMCFASTVLKYMVLNALQILTITGPLRLWMFERPGEL